jgi:transcription initiation factor TFIID subunit 9B
MDLKDIQSKDVQAIISVLKDAGIEDYEPRVVNQLLEFSYRKLASPDPIVRFFFFSKTQTNAL